MLADAMRVPTVTGGCWLSYWLFNSKRPFVPAENQNSHYLSRLGRYIHVKHGHYWRNPHLFNKENFYFYAISVNVRKKHGLVQSETHSGAVEAMRYRNGAACRFLPCRGCRARKNSATFTTTPLKWRPSMTRCSAC